MEAMTKNGIEHTGQALAATMRVLRARIQAGEAFVMARSADGYLVHAMLTQARLSPRRHVRVNVWTPGNTRMTAAALRTIQESEADTFGEFEPESDPDAWKRADDALIAAKRQRTA